MYNWYSSGSVHDPVNILVDIGSNQFNQLLFSMPELVSPFMDWMYNKVIYHTPADEGEYYLYSHHKSMVERIDQDGVTQKHWFRNLDYQIPDGSALIPSKFNSIKTIADAYTSGVSTLYDYCNCLSSLTKSTSLGLEWLLGEADAHSLVGKMWEYFTDPEYKNNQKADFVDYVVSYLIEGFPPLAYFRSYLVEHLTHDFQTFTQNTLVFNDNHSSEASCGVNHADIVQKVINSVRDFIKNKIPTILVLGGYKDSGPVDNSRYSGISSYIYQNKISLRKTDVQDIMSVMNILNEITAAVKSTPFFSEYDTSSKLLEAISDATKLSNLFKISQSAKFADQAGNVVGSDGKIKVSWNDVKDWMFSPLRTDVERLKAIVRTQLYRPLFFKYDDYKNFTSEYSVYHCTVNKFYVNHEGDTKQLVFVNADTMADVNTASSGLARSSHPTWTYGIEDISYFKTTNVLEYFLHYDKLNVVGDKFVCDDVEFYTVRPQEGIGNNTVNKVYFNEFQNQSQVTQNTVAIDSSNKFVLNGRTYQILADGKMVVNATSTDTDEQLWKD